MLGGAFIRMGTIGWALGEDIFPIEFGIMAPQLLSLCQDILCSITPPNHAAKSPKEQRWVSLSPDAYCNRWTVVHSPNLFRLQSGMSSGTAMWLDDLQPDG